MGSNVRPISTIWIILHLERSFCFKVWGHEHLFLIPCWVRNGAKALNTPPLLDWRHLIMELNCFSTKVLNFMNVGNSWSLVCKGYNHENWEQSSRSKRKYRALVVDGIGVSPQKLICIRSRILEALDSKSENGNLWFFFPY